MRWTLPLSVTLRRFYSHFLAWSRSVLGVVLVELRDLPS